MGHGQLHFLRVVTRLYSSRKERGRRLWHRRYSVFPNIVGSQGSLYPGSLEPVETGVLKFWRNANFKLTGLVATDSGAPVGVSLNASLGSSIYGVSDTVQPKGLYGLYLVRAY